MRGFLLLCTALAVTASLNAQPIAAEFYGIVTDSNGGVIEGVTVTIRASNGSQETQFRTNKEGRFYVEELPAGTYQVDFAIATLPFLPETRQVEIRPGNSVYTEVALQVDFSRLNSGVEQKDLIFTIQGTVTDQEGQPVPDATVLVQPTRNPRFWSMGTSDRNGYYSVPAHLHGHHQIFVRAPSMQSAVVILEINPSPGVEARQVNVTLGPILEAP